jgi:predicted RNA-binding protein
MPKKFADGIGKTRDRYKAVEQQCKEMDRLFTLLKKDGFEYPTRWEIQNTVTEIFDAGYEQGRLDQMRLSDIKYRNQFNAFMKAVQAEAQRIAEQVTE